MHHVRTETFFDGSYWEAPCPPGWTFRKDSTVRGFPHVFEAEPAYRLQLGWSRDVQLNYAREFEPPSNESEPMRNAYAMTCMEASYSGIRPSQLSRHDLGELSGFTYPNEGGWAGWFVAQPWYVYAVLTGPRESKDGRTREAMSILDGLRFKIGKNAA